MCFMPCCCVHACCSPTHPGQWGSTPRVMDNLGDHSFDVVVALSSIQHTELGSAHSVLCMGGEHGPTSLTLSPNHAPHLCVYRQKTKRRRGE